MVINLVFIVSLNNFRLVNISRSHYLMWLTIAATLGMFYIASVHGKRFVYII